MKTRQGDPNQSTGDQNRSRRRARHRGHGARKERVLHTRISEQLAEDIRLFADDLRVPASNLVRNVLEEVFTVVDSVSEDVGGLMDELIDEAEGVRDRVRRQANSRRERGSSRSRRRPSRRGTSTETDVEEEFRRDEAAEAAAAPRSASSRPEPEPEPEPGHPEERGEEAHRRSSTNGTQPRAAELFPEILGWQPLVLNRDLECGRCARSLPAGESAFLGIGTSGLTETALCGKCASERG